MAGSQFLYLLMHNIELSWPVADKRTLRGGGGAGGASPEMLSNAQVCAAVLTCGARTRVSRSADFC